MLTKYEFYEDFGMEENLVLQLESLTESCDMVERVANVPCREYMPCKYSDRLNKAIDTIKRLVNENKNLRNELCLKCGNYKEEHNGACNGCRWRLDR